MIRRRTGKMLFGLSGGKVIGQFEDYVAVTFENVILLQFRQGNPLPPREHLVDNLSGEGLDEIVKHVKRAAVGVNSLLMMEESSDLGDNAQFLLQFTPQALF